MLKMHFKIWKNQNSEKLQIQKAENSEYWCNTFLYLFKYVLAREEQCIITVTFIFLEHLAKAVRWGFHLDKE